MAPLALLVFSAIFETALCAVTATNEGPPKLPGNFDVVKSSDKSTVKLSAVLKSDKATLLYFPTDNCQISKGNMEYLTTLAAQNTNVEFIAVLRFLSSSAKQFSQDNGASLAQVQGYAGTGSKVVVVQDLVYVHVADTCADTSSQCPSLTANAGSCVGTVLEWCPLACKSCTPAAASSYTTFACTAPGVSGYDCGGFWNQFLSGGATSATAIQTAWDIKEQVVLYNSDGSKAGSVLSVKETYPAKSQKLWDEAHKANIVTLIGKAGSGSGGTSNAGSGSGGTSNAGSGSGGTSNASSGGNASGNGTATPAPGPAAKATADGAVQSTWRTAACIAALVPALVL